MDELAHPLGSLTAGRDKAKKRSPKKRRAMLLAPLYAALGIICAAVGLEGFLIPNHLIDGGITGLSMLVAHVVDYEVAPFLIIFNLPFIYLGYRSFGTTFAIQTAVSVMALAVLITLVEVPPITEDRVLAAIFGGVFLGMGIGLSMRGGGVLDGTEVLAVHMSRQVPFDIGDVVLAVNVVLFLSALFVYPVNAVLYSIVTYVVASKTVGYVIDGIEEHTGVFIISQESNTIRTAIIRVMGRGVTLLDGRRGYTTAAGVTRLHVVFCVVTKLEMQRLKNLVQAIDPNAFMVTFRLNDVVGGVVKRRPLH